MMVWRGILVPVLVYLSGLVLYSNLFVISANQSSAEQYVKIALASLHCLIFVLPFGLTLSKSYVLRLLGYVSIAVYFAYLVFLVSYNDYFDRVPEIYAFSSSNVNDLTPVLGHYFAQVFGWSEILLLLLAVLTFAACILKVFNRFALMTVGLSALFFLVTLFEFGSPARSEKWGNATLIRRHGLATFVMYSGYEYSQLKDGYFSEETMFPGNLVRVFGVDEANGDADFLATPVDRLMLVQIESFDREAIDATLNDVAVMPFLSGLRDQCVSFENFFTTKGLGGSADAEFTVASGLLPSDRAQAVRLADFSKIQTLYELLAEAGVESYFLHNNTVEFYDRYKMYGQLDSSVTTSFLDTSNVEAEKEFALVRLDNAVSESDRFFWYFFNFASHGPYRGYAEQTGAKFGIEKGADLKSDYLATMHEVDEMLAELYAVQEAGFEAGENMIIVTADHPSRLSNSGRRLDPYHIPTIACHASFERSSSDRITSTVDLFPTILESFGVPIPEGVMGTSLFYETEGVAVLPGGSIVRQNSAGRPELSPCQSCKSWVTYTEQFLKFQN